jgi:hypothetical protein
LAAAAHAALECGPTAPRSSLIERALAQIHWWRLHGPGYLGRKGTPPLGEANMKSASAGRLVGVLILMQMVSSVVVNFVLEAPLFGAPGFLVAAAQHSSQIGCAALLGLITESLWVAIAITVFPFTYRESAGMTLWLGALAVVVLAVAVAESAAVMSMVSVSEAYSKAGALDRGQLEMLRVLVAATRNWPHFLARMLDGCTILAFYAVLYRSALVPRVLAALGLVAAVLQVCAVAMPFFGRDVMFPLLAPLGLVQLTLAAWLIARGFLNGAR